MTYRADNARPAPSGPDGPRRAIVYMVWGEEYLRQASENARSAAFMKLPLIMITDRKSAPSLPSDHPFDDVRVIERFRSYDMRAKSTLYDNLPPEYDSFLYLDTDTQILKDASFGFEQAERFGIALSPATSYCLPSHHDFRRILLAAGRPDAGQLQYNAGVYFFVRRPDVTEVFRLYQQATYELTERFGYTNARGRLVDQPFLTYAMEVLGFNPYTLSVNYCYRGIRGEPRYGDVVIWHSHYPVPEGINDPAVPRMQRRGYYCGQPVDMKPVFKAIRAACGTQAPKGRPRAMDDDSQGKRTDAE